MYADYVANSSPDDMKDDIGNLVLTNVTFVNLTYTKCHTSECKLKCILNPGYPEKQRNDCFKYLLNS
jgi:hypothetical protein